MHFPNTHKTHNKDVTVKQEKDTKVLLHLWQSSSGITVVFKLLQNVPWLKLYL